MSACSGRNYNFRCIMLFFGMFLRESALTAAKSRTNLSTNSGKATKRLDRLTPNLACIHLGMDIRETNCPSRHKGGTWGGGLGVNIQTYGEDLRLAPTLVHVCDSSGNGHRLNPSRPSIPQGALGGGLGRGSQIQKSGEAVKWLHRLAPNLVHVSGFVWEWT